jgi:hypothetical protein
VLGGAQVVPEPLLDADVGERGDDLVAAHPDVAMDAPDRHDDLMSAERAKPGERVLVIRVDECPVEIKKSSCRDVARPSWPQGLVALG